MTAAEAVELAWTVGGSVMVVLGFLAVILTGLAVLSEVKR